MKTDNVINENNVHTIGKLSFDAMPLPSRKFIRLYNDSKEFGTILQSYGKRIKVYDDPEAEANAAFICKAVNSHDELFQMVKDLKNCIKRLTQDDLSQYDKDTEAQWEGEAHELLIRINPNYYRNANEVIL